SCAATGTAIRPPRPAISDANRRNDIARIVLPSSQWWSWRHSDTRNRPKAAAARLRRAKSGMNSVRNGQPMFDWNDLRHFLAVARHGSTLAAARALSLSQSTVHRRLDELEKQIGRPIVVRQPTGYRLTDFGRDLLPMATRVEDAVHSLERFLAASDATPTG